jgi:hypothetical protein
MAIMALLAISLFSGNARAGSLYFFCDAMQEARSEPCCARERTAPAGQLDVLDCPCCRAHRVDPLPRAVTAALASIVAASPWVLAPSIAALLQASPVAPASWTRRRQTGPPRATDPCRLMVFRN